MVRFEELPDDAPDLVQKPENGEFSCPVCGDFTGKRSSVEAHITGKSDAQHKGLVGKDFRVPQRNGPDLLSADKPVLKNDNGVTFLVTKRDSLRLRAVTRPVNQIPALGCSQLVCWSAYWCGSSGVLATMTGPLRCSDEPRTVPDGLGTVQFRRTLRDVSGTVAGRCWPVDVLVR
jgi:hypothetical protein